MSDVKELLKGGYDLHVHSAPDCLPRKMDDIDMAKRITDSTLSGYAIKNHWTSTAGRAQLINKGIIYPVKYRELDFTVPQFSGFIHRLEEYKQWDTI